MAISRVEAADVGLGVVRLYADLERRLVQEVALRLARANADPDVVGWAQRHLREVTGLRRVSEALVRGLGDPAQEAASRAVLDAMTVGRRAALREAMALRTTPGAGSAYRLARQALDRGDDLPGAPAIIRVANALAGRLGELNLPIVRWATDAFQRVIAAGAAPGVLSGLDTRRKASERAWNQLLNHGVTGFTDARGRNWQLSTYVEMATRTATAHAAIEAHNGQLGSLGLELVIVSDVAGECELCRPWEGKILTTRGAGGARRVSVQRLDSPNYVEVAIAGSVDEARAAGLFHPSCRHNISAYFPGITSRPKAPTPDPAGAKAREDLRKLERDKRRWLQREAGALTPEAKRAARAKVKDIDGKIETLIDERGGVERGLPRRRDRERINLGNKRVIPGTTPSTALPMAGLPEGFQLPEGIELPTIPPADASKVPIAGNKPAKDPRANLGHGVNTPTGGYAASLERYGPFQQPLPPTLVFASGTPTPDEILGRLRFQNATKTNGPGRFVADRITEAEAEIMRQATIVPRTAYSLQGISVQSYEEWTRFTGGRSSIKAAYEPGYFSIYLKAEYGEFKDSHTESINRTEFLTEFMARYSRADDGSGLTGNALVSELVSHEFGHHVYRTIREGDRGQLYEATYRELGLNHSFDSRTPSSIWEAALSGIMQGPRGKAVKAALSEYGTQSYDEFFAEVWAEWSTLGDRARPLAQALGPLMARLAEDGAFD